jgi:hypothetical protein
MLKTADLPIFIRYHHGAWKGDGCQVDPRRKSICWGFLHSTGYVFFHLNCPYNSLNLFAAGVLQQIGETGSALATLVRKLHLAFGFNLCQADFTL